MPNVVSLKVSASLHACLEGGAVCSLLLLSDCKRELDIFRRVCTKVKWVVIAFSHRHVARNNAFHLLDSRQWFRKRHVFMCTFTLLITSEANKQDASHLLPDALSWITS